MRFCILLCGVIYSCFAWAGVYRCADQNGKIAYQKTPCVNLEEAIELNVNTGGHKLLDKEEQAKLSSQIAELTEKQRIELAKQQKQQAKEKLLEESAKEAQKNQAFIKYNKLRFSPYAIPPYTGKRFSSLADSFEERLPEIEQYRRIAAEKVLKSDQCRRIEASDLDPLSPLKKLRFWVECSNGKRIKFSEQDLTTNAQAKVNKTVTE